MKVKVFLVAAWTLLMLDSVAQNEVAKSPLFEVQDKYEDNVVEVIGVHNGHTFVASGIEDRRLDVMRIWPDDKDETYLEERASRRRRYPHKVYLQKLDEKLNEVKRVDVSPKEIAENKNHDYVYIDFDQGRSRVYYSMFLEEKEEFHVKYQDWSESLEKEGEGTLLKVDVESYNKLNYFEIYTAKNGNDVIIYHLGSDPEVDEFVLIMVSPDGQKLTEEKFTVNVKDEFHTYHKIGAVGDVSYVVGREGGKEGQPEKMHIYAAGPGKKHEPIEVWLDSHYVYDAHIHAIENNKAEVIYMTKHIETERGKIHFGSADLATGELETYSAIEVETIGEEWSEFLERNTMGLVVEHVIQDRDGGLQIACRLKRSVLFYSNRDPRFFPLNEVVERGGFVIERRRGYFFVMKVSQDHDYQWSLSFPYGVESQFDLEERSTSDYFENGFFNTVRLEEREGRFVILTNMNDEAFATFDPSTGIKSEEHGEVDFGGYVNWDNEEEEYIVAITIDENGKGSAELLLDGTKDDTMHSLGGAIYDAKTNTVTGLYSPDPSDGEEYGIYRIELGK